MNFLMIKYIASVTTMGKLVLFIWSFFIHCGSFKGLLYPRDSFGKKMYLNKCIIYCWLETFKPILTLSYKNGARHTLGGSLFAQVDLCDVYKSRKLTLESVKSGMRI